jgi:hypothetical protein
LRVGDRRTALSNNERAKKAAEQRWNGGEECSVADGDHQASEKPKTRIRTEVAKQAAVSEKRIRAVAEIRREDPEAYQRIVTGKSTIREEKAAIGDQV